MITKEQGKEEIKKLVETPAILMKKVCFTPTATILTNNDYVPVNTVYVIHSKKNVPLEYLLAILNSKLIGFYTRRKYGATAMRGGFIELRTFEIEKIPIKIDQKLLPQITKNSSHLLSLNKRLNEIKDKQTDEKTRLEKEIQKTDEEIDQEVYKIYGITKEEQKIIEESLK